MHSSSVKKTGLNALIYGIGTIFGRAATFLLIPLFTHTLSVDEYGILSTLLITSQLLVILIDCGMRNTLIRFYHEYNEKAILGQLIGSTLVISIFAFIITTGSAFILFKSFFHHYLTIANPERLTLLLCAASFGQSLFLHLQSYFRAKNEAIKFAISGIIYSILVLSLTFISLVLLQLNLEGIFMAQIISSGIIIIYILYTIIITQKLKISFKSIIECLKFGFPLIFSMSGEYFIGAAAVYYLNFLATLKDVAIYSLGLKLANITILVFILPFRLAFEPYIFSISRSRDIKTYISKIFTLFFLGYIFVAFILSIIIYFLMPIIAPSDYSFAYFVLVSTLPAFLFYGLYYFGEILINLVKKTKTTGIIVSSCSILSLIYYYILIKSFHLYGAIFSITIAYITIGLFVMLFGLKFTQIKLEWKRIAIIICIFMINNFMLLISYNLSNKYFYLIILALVLLNILIFSLTGFLNDNEKELIMKLYSQFQHRIKK